MNHRRLVPLAAAVAGSALTISACGSSDSASSGGDAKGPIVIGAAVDNTDFMKSIDQPPLAAAKLQAAKINAAGGVDGRKIVFKTINTQLNPEKTRSAATKLIEDEKADILWVTCDVDLSTPSIQVGLAAKKLTVAPCIGTDQMGPKRFGDAGDLAYSFGNVAQDEGAAMAKVAQQKGWKTANVISDKALVYTQNVCAAFATKFKQLGGQVTTQQSFTAGDNTVSGLASKVNRATADADVLCTTAGPDLPAFVTGLRGLGNDTPILGSWAIDGTYWLPKSAKAANNISLVTYASIYGNDPDPAVNALVKKLTAAGQAPSTAGFVTGPATVDAIAQAIKQNGGKVDGAELAATMEKFQKVSTSTGPVSFSKQWHSVFGREYRVITIKAGKPQLDGTVKSDGPVQLPAA